MLTKQKTIVNFENFITNILKNNENRCLRNITLNNCSLSLLHFKFFYCFEF